MEKFVDRYVCCTAAKNSSALKNLGEARWDEMEVCAAFACLALTRCKDHVNKPFILPGISVKREFAVRPNVCSTYSAFCEVRVKEMLRI